MDKTLVVKFDSNLYIGILDDAKRIKRFNQIFPSDKQTLDFSDTEVLLVLTDTAGVNSSGSVFPIKTIQIDQTVDHSNDLIYDANRILTLHGNITFH